VKYVRPLVTPYRVFWAIVLTLFSVFVWWLLIFHPGKSSDETIRVKVVSIDDEPPTQEDLSKRIGKVGVDVEGVEFSLSSNDGELILRVWADRAIKLGGRFELGQGTLLFSLPNKHSLLIRLSNCMFSTETDTVEITGTITGQVLDTGQYFTAEELNWYMGGNSVDAERVIYRGPNIEVQGEAMSIDLKTGRIDFTGPVHAGV
jgi:hypothetical protein